MTRLVAFDLDGTLTQHKSPMSAEIRATLDGLRARGYALLMVGAGDCARIARQMEGYPIDILGNYGMQYAEWDDAARTHRLVSDERRPCDRGDVLRRANAFRAKHGLTDFAGDSVEFHDSGVVTLALLGTKAAAPDKLAFDPDRRRRRALFDEVRALFPDFKVFVGGSSSFDMAPAPFDKAYALGRLCEARGLAKDEVLYVGDDYGPGGNDESVLLAGFPFLRIDDYRDTPSALRARLPGASSAPPPAPSVRRPRSGQALVEFTVGLMALLIAVVAILVVGALGRGETDAMAEAQARAAERSLGSGIAESFEPVSDVDRGPDGLWLTTDDEPVAGSLGPVRVAVAGGVGLSAAQNAVPEASSPRGDDFGEFAAGGSTSVFGFRSAEGSAVAELPPAAGLLGLRGPEVEQRAKVWMPMTGGL